MDPSENEESTIGSEKSELSLESRYFCKSFRRISPKFRRNSLLMFNCLNGTAPSYLTSLVTRYEPPSSLRRLSSRPELVVPRIKTKKYGSTSFSYAGPAIWNALPYPWDLLQPWHSSAPPWKPISVVLLLKTEIYMLPLPQVIAVPLSILFVKVHVKYSGYRKYPYGWEDQ